jgi:hypothetical protein
MDVLSSRSDRESLRTEALLRRDRDARSRGISPDDLRAMEERRPLGSRRREANVAAVNRARGSEEVRRILLFQIVIFYFLAFCCIAQLAPQTSFLDIFLDFSSCPIVVCGTCALCTCNDDELQVEVTSLLVTGQSLGREEMTAMELIDHAEEVAAREAAREAASNEEDEEERAEPNETGRAEPGSSDDDDDEDEESDEYVCTRTLLLHFHWWPLA